MVVEIGIDEFNLPEEADHVACRQESVRVYRNGQQFAGDGTLYITKEDVIWWDDLLQRGLLIEYPQMGLHAIARDTSTFSFPSIYCQVEVTPSITIRMAGDDDAQPVEEDDNDFEDVNDDQDEPMEELRFVPADILSLEPMYLALCQCQALHPDPMDEDAGEMFTADDLTDDLTDEGQALDDRFAALIEQGDIHFSENGAEGQEDDEQEDAGQYDDAE